MAGKLGIGGNGKLFRQSGRFKTFQNVDWILWGIPLLMVSCSGVLIASTQRQADYADWHNHWSTAFLGFLIALNLARIPLERLRSLLIPTYWLTVLSLVLVRLIGSSALGAQRWISIGGVNVQPSEFAKLSAILLLAAVLERHPVERPIDLVRPLAIISVPWALVFVQPDLGTSLVFGALLIAMLYWSGMPLEWALLVISPLVTAVLVGLQEWLLALWIPLISYFAYRSLPWKRLVVISSISLHGLMALITPWLWLNGLKDYQRDRLILFLDPLKDPLGGGYHLLQSTVGIGSGGLFGTGLLQGQLTKLRFIPEQHTDFIFSALGEETGFLGTLLVVVGFTCLMVRLLNVARQARSDFESLIVVGIGTMVMFQVVVNIFMTIGLGPVTGIPLPFMSYGRTALIVNFIALGMCLSVSRRGVQTLRGW